MNSGQLAVESSGVESVSRRLVMQSSFQTLRRPDRFRLTAPQARCIIDQFNGAASNRRRRHDSSGRPLTFGYTAEGRHLAVIWDHVFDDPLTIYPVTAFDAKERT